MSVNSKMTAIADAIREKTGGTDPLTLDQMAGQIADISTGTDTSNGTVTPQDMREGVVAYSQGQEVVGSLPMWASINWNTPTASFTDGSLQLKGKTGDRRLLEKDSPATMWCAGDKLGSATAADVAKGKTFTSAAGLLVEGTGLVAGGGFVYPDGAFAPVTSFTDGKQYALVSMIGGVRRYISTTNYNDYTMTATEITVSEDTGDYVIFSATPVLFTAVASGEGFLLQNGDNYLHGTSSGGTALRVGTTQMAWKVDTSETAGFSEGKYNPKEDAGAVWLIADTADGYTWSIKYETGGGFGYDREGRDSTWSTGFAPFVLYEYVAGEGEVSPIVDTSDANVTANKMLAGYSGYANGRKVEGNIQSRAAQTITPGTTAQEIPAGVYLAGKQTIAAIQTQTKTVTANGTVTPDSGKYLSSVTVNVPTGITPSGTKSITANGTHEVSNYAYAQVDVPGYVIKSGTTTSKTVETGLSSVEEFFAFRRSLKSTGLIYCHYSRTSFEGNPTQLVATAWSSTNYGTKTVNTYNEISGDSSGGTFVMARGELAEGETYYWVAVGME